MSRFISLCLLLAVVVGESALVDVVRAHYGVETALQVSTWAVCILIGMVWPPIFRQGR